MARGLNGQRAAHNPAGGGCMGAGEQAGCRRGRHSAHVICGVIHHHLQHELNAAHADREVQLSAAATELASSQTELAMLRTAHGACICRHLLFGWKKSMWRVRILAEGATLPD